MVTGIAPETLEAVGLGWGYWGEPTGPRRFEGKTLELNRNQLEVNGRLFVGSVLVEVEFRIPVQDQGITLEPPDSGCAWPGRVHRSEGDLVSGNRNGAEFWIALPEDLKDRLILAAGENGKGESRSFLNETDDGLGVGLVRQGENLSPPGSYKRLELRGARAIIGASCQKVCGPEKESTQQERTSRNESHATLATPERNWKDGPSNPNFTAMTGKRQENSGFPL